MGKNRLFWPQEILDQWILDEKIVLDGEKLTLKEENLICMVHQAVFFSADVGDGSDPHNLVGRVKECATLEEMGAERYMDSVLIGDSAYRVVPGFTGEPVVEAQSSARSSSASMTSHVDNKEKMDEKELLAQFLIDNL